MAADGTRGVYRKYDIRRTDGSSEPGGKHYDCTYFVLDIEHDPFAIPALRAYAEACRETHPKLANDLLYVCDGVLPKGGANDRMRLALDCEVE